MLSAKSSFTASGRLKYTQESEKRGHLKDIKNCL